MLILGWIGGGNIQRLVRDYDHWIASGILAFVGSKMIWESFRGGAAEFRNDPEGFLAFGQWLAQHRLVSAVTVVCLEAESGRWRLRWLVTPALIGCDRRPSADCLLSSVLRPVIMKRRSTPE
jgi:hypothetical protein